VQILIASRYQQTQLIQINPSGEERLPTIKPLIKIKPPVQMSLFG
jgi:hypothetical protein